MSNSNIPDNSVAAYEAMQDKVSKEGDWVEFIADYIGHRLWAVGKGHYKMDRALAAVQQDLVIWMLEGESLYDILVSSLQGEDCHTVGYEVSRLGEKEIARYCEFYQDSLIDQFPVAWEDFKEQNP